MWDLDLVLLITSFGFSRSHCNVMISIQHPLHPTEDALHADGICKRELHLFAYGLSILGQR